VDTFEGWKSIDIRTGKVVSVEDATGTEKPFYLITADFGSEIGKKITVAGLPSYYKKKELLGKNIVGVVNLPPKKIGPNESQFLILAVKSDDKVALLSPDKTMPEGLKVF
jgi:tRNA-binding protein